MVGLSLAEQSDTLVSEQLNEVVDGHHVDHHVTHANQGDPYTNVLTHVFV